MQSGDEKSSRKSPRHSSNRCMAASGHEAAAIEHPLLFAPSMVAASPVATTFFFQSAKRTQD
jgi:hypothetical protein